MKNSAIILVVLTSIMSISTFADVKRIIVFGDSLSDTGTYSNMAAPLGGGRFTTNPDKIWIEYVADYYNLEVKPNRLEGFGQPTQLVNGTNYAQGGSRVSNTKGNGSDKGYSARPLIEQALYFENEYKKFTKFDLVFLQGGANDVFVLLTEVAAGLKKPDEAIKEVTIAASELGNIAIKLKEMGAEKLFVMNLPQIEKTPKIILLDPNTQKFVAAMTNSFNNVLSKALSKAEIQMLDIYSFDKNFNLNYVEFGFVSISEQACKTDHLPIKSSLLCTEKDLVSPLARENYKFADAIHPTSGYTKLIKDYILRMLPENNNL